MDGDFANLPFAAPVLEPHPRAVISLKVGGSLKQPYARGETPQRQGVVLAYDHVLEVHLDNGRAVCGRVRTAFVPTTSPTNWSGRVPAEIWLWDGALHVTLDPTPPSHPVDRRWWGGRGRIERDVRGGIGGGWDAGWVGVVGLEVEVGAGKAESG